MITRHRPTRGPASYRHDDLTGGLRTLSEFGSPRQTFWYGLARCRSLTRRSARTCPGASPSCLRYGVGVLASLVNRATFVTQATASSVPSLRTSPAAFGGKRAESPSLS